MTPYCELPERTFRAAGLVPPMMLPLALLPMNTPLNPLASAFDAAGISADVIAENDIAGRVRVGDEDAVLRIAGEDISRQRVGAADDVPARAGGDENSLIGIRRGVGAGGVKAKPAAGNGVVRRVRINQREAVPVEAGEGNVFDLVARRVNQHGVRREGFGKDLRGVHDDERFARKARLRGAVNHHAVRHQRRQHGR